MKKKKIDTNIGKQIFIIGKPELGYPLLVGHIIGVEDDKFKVKVWLNNNRDMVWTSMVDKSRIRYDPKRMDIFG